VTADQLVYAIESIGGSVVVNGEKLKIKAPDELVEAVRAQRDAVLSFLRQRGSFEMPSIRCQVHGLHNDWWVKDLPLGPNDLMHTELICSTCEEEGKQ
jgi:hypothetical protein